MNVPVVSALHVAPGRRLPTRSVESVEIVQARGIVGDRYEGAKHRQVSIQSLEAIREAEADFGAPIDPGSTRRNITISHGAVPTEPGALIRIGTAVLEVVRVAAPCKLLDDAIGPNAQHALRRRAGSICRVLESGVVSTGDEVHLPELVGDDRKIGPPRTR
ncbi:MOSC domain-containing protein [Nocardioides sp. CCNWLW239]|uniref:MOSC domain-containing protein n=1 Tax=Nocardioides sp. CCNWLW239 TaxID=3128902 RepID=UPI003015DCED